MKHQEVIALVAFLLIAGILLSITQAFASLDVKESSRTDKTSALFRFGLTFGGNTTQQAKTLIDRVKTYTNLFVIQSGPISKDEKATTEISEYAIDAGLDLIVYFGWLDPAYPWRLPWLMNAKQQWGDRFLGVYFGDEPQGAAIDYDWKNYFNNEKSANSSLYQEHIEAIEHTLKEVAHSEESPYPHDYDRAADISIGQIKQRLALQNLSDTSY